MSHAGPIRVYAMSFADPVGCNSEKLMDIFGCSKVNSYPENLQ